MIYVPSPRDAIGNLSLTYATHVAATNGQGSIHPDGYKYGSDRTLVFENVSDVGVVGSKGFINAFTHLRIPKIGDIMQACMQPSDYMKGLISIHCEKIKHCVAVFHIRRGTYADDSAKFGNFPFGSDRAVEAMIGEALKIDEPVLIMSDSVSTREYFLRRVHKALSLGLDIGFTASEFSQETETPEEEGLDTKTNSILEWFIMSKMPRIYTTMGGVCGRNVPEGNMEGLSSTFGYSAALYGGKIPYYVFNDGFIIYPDGNSEPKYRYSWSDPFTTLKYITMKPDRENIERAKKFLSMHPVILMRSECTEDYEGVMYAEDGNYKAVYVLRYDTPVEPGDEEMIRLWKRGEGELRE